MNNPIIVCSKCGAHNEIEDKSCWKCKRPISEEERQGARERSLAALSVDERKAFLDKEAQSRSPSRGALGVSGGRKDYQTSYIVANIVSAVGWIVCAIAVLVVVTAVAGAGTMGLVALAPGLGLFLGGLLAVIAGQSSRAILDTANYSRRILEEMQTKA